MNWYWWVLTGMGIMVVAEVALILVVAATAAARTSTGTIERSMRDGYDNE